MVLGRGYCWEAPDFLSPPWQNLNLNRESRMGAIGEQKLLHLGARSGGG